MRPVPPPQDLPPNLRPAKFSAPPEISGEVNDIYGVIHLDEEGNANALEFQFQLSKDEIKVLRHEPYITLTILADHLHPFALQTSFPTDEKYDKLMEHQHVCNTNLTHDKQKWWRCDNPSHDSETSEQRIRVCDECWQERLRSGPEDETPIE